jgi:hypothetical protein
MHNRRRTDEDFSILDEKMRLVIMDVMSKQARTQGLLLGLLLTRPGGGLACV